MKAGQKDRERSHTDWIASLHDARSRCRQALMQASVDVSDPGRALWPAVPRQLMTREHKTVAQCHAAVLDYAEHVEPFENRCSRHWTADIAQPYKLPEGEQLEIALSEIEQWADKRYKLQVGEKNELTGTQETSEIRRIHLPTRYARLSFRQLNKCLEALNLAADPPTPERTVDDPTDAW